MSSLGVRVGELRPSQLLWSFGVGAIVDLPNLSVVVAGLDDWEQANATPVPEARLVEQLQGLQRERGIETDSANGHYHAPRSLQALAEVYRDNPEAQILAGGTDVGLWVTKQLRELPTIVYLGDVVELRQIETTEEHIEIGAAVSLTDAFAALEPHYPAFAEMFRRFASVPVRNAGTLVGNIANGSPIGDSMPALIVTGASVVLRRGDATRELPMEALYLDYMKNAMQPGEFIQSVKVPLAAADTVVRCYKLSKRFDQDISAVCAAFALTLQGGNVVDVRIALGGMAAIPKRASQTEECLRGKPWNEDSVRTAMIKIGEEFTPLSDMRASADYRSRTTANLLYRFFLQTRSKGALSELQTNVFRVSA